MSLTTRIAAALTTRQAGVGAGSWSLMSTAGWGGIFLDEDESRWTASAVAYRCVLAVAGNAASLPLQVRNLADDTTVEGHWLSALWERPNPLWSRRMFAEVLWSKLETRGEAFVFLDRGATGQGQVQEMWPIFGQVVPVIAGRRRDTTPDTWGGPTQPRDDDEVQQELIGYQVTLRSGRRIGLLPSEMLWLRYPDPRVEWGCLSPLAAAGHAVELDAYARAWQRGELKNGAKPSNVIYLGAMSQEDYNRAVETFRSQVSGPENAGKSLLIASENPGHVDALTRTAQEVAWLDTRQVSTEEVLVAFGVPKDYLLGGATYENRREAKVTLWSDTIVSKLEIVAGEITRQVLQGENRRARFDTDDVDALQENADAKAKRTTDLAAHDLLLIDEARAEMGFEPIGGVIGGLTISAYRALIQTQAQATLLQGQAPSDRNALLQIVTNPGRVGVNLPAAPLLLPSGMRLHGPSKDTILMEYDRHERVITKAVARLAKRQQAVVLTNADRLFAGKTKKAAAWEREFTAAFLDWQGAVGTDREADTEAEVRAKVDQLFDPKHWKKETAEALEAPIGGAWESGATQLAKSLGLDFDKFDLLVLTAMDSRLDVLSTKVTDTTRQVLQDRVLLQGVANGESVPQLKARIRGVFSDLSSWRGTMIARTETVGGFNKASHVIAEASGVVVEREWGATADTRTRDSHVAQDGQRVKGFTARYTNGCLHPGDPTARPEETVQCRCVEYFVTKD